MDSKLQRQCLRLQSVQHKERICDLTADVFQSVGELHHVFLLVLLKHLQLDLQCLMPGG